WRKWRRRRPHAAALAGMSMTVVLATLAVGAGAAAFLMQRAEQAEVSLRDGRSQSARGDFDGAVRTLRGGLAAAWDLPFHKNLVEELNVQLRPAELARDEAARSASARELHRLADRVRYFYDAPHLRPHDLPAIDAACRAFWDDRARVVERLSVAGALDPSVR